MKRDDLESQAERYKREIMDLYSRNAPVQNEPDKSDQSDTAEEANETEAPEEYIMQLPDDTAYSDDIGDEEEESAEDFNVRYPEPDLSELNTDYGMSETNDNMPPEYVSEESLGDSVGYVIVNVRTGDESQAIAGATVLISAIVAGNRMIIASGVTDQNGTTSRFEVPVPALSLSQSPDTEKRPYNLFDVSVTAEGFFNARSVDVPVFSGITSIQNFNMIPVPLMMDPRDETVTYFNQEPDYRGGYNQGG